MTFYFLSRHIVLYFGILCKNKSKYGKRVCEEIMRLKKVRVYADLNIKEVANMLGVSRSSYNTWEREYDIIPLRQLDRFCSIFHVSLDFVLGFSDEWSYPNSRDTIDPELLAKRIKRIRRENDLTQDELSKILNITRSSISKYEHGINLALTSYIMGFCKYFHISADFVTGRIDEEITLDTKINS